MPLENTYESSIEPRPRGRGRIVPLLCLLLVVFAATRVLPAERCTSMRSSLEILDESAGKRVPGESLATVGDAKFQSYVTEVSQHIARKAGEPPQCFKHADGGPAIALYFVYRPLIVTHAPRLRGPTDFEKSGGEVSCRVDSPWATIRAGRSPSFFLRAVFTWSERQVLLDQALLADAHVVHTAPLAPLEPRAFDNFVRDYTESVLLAPSRDRQRAQIGLAERIPAEVLWLFRQAWQSTRAPFSMEARHALTETMQWVAPHYVSLTKALVNRCFVSTRVEERYDGVLELSKIFPISEYRINAVR